MGCQKDQLVVSKIGVLIQECKNKVYFLSLALTISIKYTSFEVKIKNLLNSKYKFEVLGPIRFLEIDLIRD